MRLIVDILDILLAIGSLIVAAYTVIVMRKKK